MQAYEQGTFTGGKGPGKEDLDKRSYADQAKRAQAFSNELLKYIDNSEDAPQPKSHETFVDERSSHRHDPPRRSQKHPAPKPVKRPCPFRKNRSKTFTRVLEITKKLTLKVNTEVVISKFERHYTLAAKSGLTYDVEIKAFPECSCRYCSERELCSHIVWLLLNRFNVSEDNNVLQQRGYTSQEILDMFSTAERSPRGVTNKTPSPREPPNHKQSFRPLLGNNKAHIKHQAKVSYVPYRDQARGSEDHLQCKMDPTT